MNKIYLIFICLVTLCLWPDEGKTYELAIGEDAAETSSLYEKCMLEGINNLSKTRFAEAERFFREAKTLCPVEPGPYINLATINIYRNNISEAIRLLNMAQGLASDDSPEKKILFYNLGLCFYINGDYEKSIQYYYQALEEDPFFAEALYGVGINFHNMGELKYAIENLSAAKSIFQADGKYEYLRKVDERLDILEKEKLRERHRYDKLLQDKPLKMLKALQLIG